MTPEILARLAVLNIQASADAREYFMLVRDDCVALVHRTAAGYSIGSSGLMIESGLAYLVWREGRPLLAGKGGETAAQADQVETLRKFSEDVKTALFPAAQSCESSSTGN